MVAGIRTGLFAAKGVARLARTAHGRAMPDPSPSDPSSLDDPAIAAFAWARYRRVMRWMMLVTIALVLGALVLLYRKNGAVAIDGYIALALGIAFVMLLASALMGLRFLPRRTRPRRD